MLGVFLLATLGWTVIEGDNKDFHLFGSLLLNIAIFASLFILFGVVVVPLFDWIARWLPALSFQRRFVLLFLPTSYSLLVLGGRPSAGNKANRAPRTLGRFSAPTT